MTDIRHPTRIVEFDGNSRYYPRELSIDEDNKLHMRSADGATDILINSNNADTLDGKHADEFATASDIEELREQVENITIAPNNFQAQIITWEADD